MSKFIYRMQNILNLKEKLEEQAKMAYSTQLKVVADAEARKTELLSQRAYFEEVGIRLRLDDLDLLKIKENKDDVRAMDDLIRAQEKVIRRERIELEERRKRFEEVMKERKAQDKLKEHAFEQFLRDENAAESKQIDELTSYKYGVAGKAIKKG